MTPSSQPLSLDGEKGLFGAEAERLCGAVAMLLGWRPAEFWQATPAEIATALSPHCSAAEAPNAQTIEELRQRFPDE